MAREHHIPTCKVKLDGSDLPVEKAARLTRVEVDLNVDLFGSCALVFNDPQMELMNGTDFAAGARIEVSLGFASKLGPVFDGEVVALEPAFRRDQPPALRVVCFESLHRLGLSQATRSLNDVDANDAATQIGQEHGLTAEAPTGTKEHFLQGNVTDAAFLKRLAQKAGQHLRIDGKKIVISAPLSAQPIELAPGDQILKMKVKVSTQSQVESVSVHGWDPKAKAEIVGTASGEGDVGEGARTYGNGKTLSIEGTHAPADQQTAEEMAKGRMRKLAEGFVTAEAQVTGDPRLLPGAAVNCSKLGEQLDGTYRIEKAHHVFSKFGYRVNFNAVRTAKKANADTAKAEKMAALVPETPVTEVEDGDERIQPAARQAAVLKQAAQDGMPLVEECASASSTMSEVA
jgi:phage protein D